MSVIYPYQCPGWLVELFTSTGIIDYNSSMAEMRIWLSSCLFLLISGHCAAQQSVLVPDATTNSSFSYQIKVEGGTAPYTFELADSTQLPAGLLLDNNSGVISGTPTQARREAFTFTVLITDDSDPKQTLKQTFTLKVQAGPLRVTDNFETAGNR